MSNTELLVKLRDAHRMAADALDEYLENMGSADAKKWTWNPFTIAWTQQQGPKGAYEKSADVNNKDYQALVKDLETHRGNLIRDHIFYWLFEDGKAVGRKSKLGKQS